MATFGAGSEIDLQVKVSGVSEVNKALENLQAKIVRKYLRTALNEITDALIAPLQHAAPFSGENLHRPAHTYHTKGGDRRASYTMKHLRDSIEAYGKGGSRASVRRQVRGNFYARFLEKGTSTMKAEPFIRPVIDGAAHRILEQYVNLISKAIEENKEDL